MNTDCITLAQDLVRIPSYVKMFDKDGKLLARKKQINEIRCAKYIEKYLNNNTKLKITKQLVKDGRYNLLAGNITNPKLVVFAHMDTVAPSKGSISTSFGGMVKGGKLYGLGSTDMKAGVAALLFAASKIGYFKNTLFVFYIDEEYDFAGMKSFANIYSYLRPEMILSADFEGLMNGCRGLIEISGTVLGKSAHACRPEKGRSSICGTIDIIEKTKLFVHDQFGGSLASSFNLGFLEAGKGESVAS